jgi:hypothetical protein
MPFTLSHVAAALPLRRLNLVWSAFVVGSMAPDVPYIVGSTDYRSLGHEFPGIIKFTLPASFFALWLFHAVIKRPAATLLPIGMQQRLRGQLGEFKFGGPTRFVAILLSLVLGIATHLVWDALTHPFSWLWWRRPWLQTLVKVPVLGQLPMFEVLQYLSSAIGLVALAVWIRLWYCQTVALPPIDTKKSTPGTLIALSMIGMAIVIGLIRGWQVVGMPKNLDMADGFLLVFGVTGIALVFWQVLIYCVMISSHQTWTIS